MRKFVDDILASLQTSIKNMLTSVTSLNLENQLLSLYSPPLIRFAIQSHGPDATLRSLIRVLLQLSDSHSLLFALDLISTIIYVVEHQLRDTLWYPV
jgi:hypothetical protein